MAVLAPVAPPDTIVVYAKRRNIELIMLLLGQSLSAGAWLVTHLNLYAKLPDDYPIVLACWFAVGLSAHFVVRWRLPWADPIILPIAFFLNGLGLVIIDRLAQAKPLGGASPKNQLIWTGLSIVVCLVTILIIRDHRKLQGYAYILFIFGIALLMLPFIPGLGRSINGAKIWIHFAGRSFQPAELAKIVLAFAFAAYLVEKKEVLALAGKHFLGIDLPRARDLFPIGLMWAIAMVILIFQNDLGTGVLIFSLFAVMLYVATERPSWPILAVLLILCGGYAAYRFTKHVARRVSSWLEPFSDYDRNYQIIQGQFGFAWGGITGRGLGLGNPWRTPLAFSDMIPAAIGEELGLLGITAIIILYGLFVSRGFKAALVSQDGFSKLLAVGLSFTIAIQVFLIIGGVTRLLPLTGLTTPFMSQGGSSLLSNWIIVALLLVISHRARMPRAPRLADSASVENLVDDETRVIEK